MSKTETRLFNIICYVWMAVLLFGLNLKNQLTSPGVLLFAVVFFCLVDLVLERPWLGAVIKTLVSLLLIHRTFYVGSIISVRWLTWLWADLLNDWQFLLNRGYLNPSAVTGMVVALIVTALIQSLYFALITRRKGVIWLLFFGTFLLVAVSLWYQQSTSLLIFLYVVMGLMILATVRLQEVNLEFSLYRWLSVLLVWSLCLTSVAWVLPDGRANFYDWYQQAQEVWEEFKARNSTGPPIRGVVGYGAYDDNLGQPLTNSFDLLFHVYSPVPLYLRGESRDFYTGRGWNDSIRALPLPQPHSTPTRLFYPSGITGKELSITVNIFQRQSRVLFSPRYPMEFDFGSESPYFITGVENEYGDFEFFLTRALEQQENYKIKIFIPDDKPELLRLTGHQMADPRYLQLPVDMPRRVRDLAQMVTAQADNGYDKVVALLNHLTQNYPYTLDSRTPPPGQDFVDHFLFAQGEGYCVHFSTALVVMSRSLGIPARWVKGYSSGLKAADSYYITSGNAHSWVEVWFDDYGWVPFEPTPGYTTSNPTDGTPNPHPGGDNPGGGSNNPSNPTNPEEPQIPTQPGDDPGSVIGITLDRNVVLAISFMIIALIGLLALIGTKIRRGKGIVGAYSWLQANLSWFGWQRSVWETPREHLLRVLALVPEPALMEGVVKDFERTLYGGEAEDVQSYKGVYRSFSLLRLLRHRLKNK